MTIVRVQGVGATQTTQGALTDTISGSGSGNLLACVVALKASSVSLSATVADSTSTSWTAGPSVAQSTNSWIGIFYRPNCPSGVTGVTATPTASTTVAMWVWEFSGLATGSPVDVAGTAAAWASTTAATTPGITTLDANDIVIAALEWPGSPTIGGQTGGFTAETTQKSNVTGNISSLSPAYQIVSATGTYTYAGTLSVAAVGAGAITSFAAVRINAPIAVGQAVQRAANWCRQTEHSLWLPRRRIFLPA